MARHTRRLDGAVIRVLFLFGLFLSVTACSWLQPFPNTEEHIVARDDSLYAIAWRYEIDFRDLAKWNGLTKPYKLYPGQRLVLHPFGGGPTKRPIVQPTSKPEAPRKPSGLKTQPVKTQPSQSAKVVAPSPKPTISSIPQQDTESRASATAPSAGAATASTGTKQPAQVAKAAPPVAPAPKPVAPPKAVERVPERPVRTRNGWAWPTAGKPRDSYKQTGTGISIPGKPGQSIHAARKGKVVYAGSGLKGYGLLIIIKHSDEYLTAYGYNDRVLVAQGEEVKAGERIATMGLGPENKSLLHFELRRNGRPVDPMRVLPSPE
jgi:lipoprotein NlpD